MQTLRSTRQRLNWGTIRVPFTVFLAGINLILIQWIMVRELTMVLLGTELVILIVSATYFLGLSVGYLLAGRIKAQWLPALAGVTLIIHLTLPVLFRLYVGAKRGGTKDAPGRPRRGTRQQAAEHAHAAHPRPTKLALARELLALVAGWADGRTVYAVVDSAYAARPLLEARPTNVQVLSRLRPDAALWARPGRRRPGQRGRPRKRGHRLPTPKAMAATRRRWDPLPLTLYGRQVTPRVFGCTALWYGALREQPVRIVIVRDPGGRRRDEAFFCTDLTVDHAFILEGYARRWTIEVAFHDQKQFLGFEDPQNQTATAVARTAPMAALAYDLVLLWYAARVQQGRASDWLRRPWYRSKSTPSFLDMLTAVRQESWQLYFADPPSSTGSAPVNRGAALRTEAGLTKGGCIEHSG